MAETTALDAAHARMESAPEDDAARLAYHAALADTPLWLLLEAEAEGDAIRPRLAETGEGSLVLAFDSEDRLAAFARGIAPQAAMPGRALIGMLAGQGIGLGLNIGVAPSETVLPSVMVDWLAGILTAAPEEQNDAQPEALMPPDPLPEPLLRALDARLARAAGLADCAYLAGMRYADGRNAHMLAVIGAPAGAERAIAGAVAEAVRFGGDDAPGLDVAFLAPGDAMIARLEAVGLRIDLPEPPDPAPGTPAPPGSDPGKPPILR